MPLTDGRPSALQSFPGHPLGLALQKAQDGVVSQPPSLALRVGMLRLLKLHVLG